MHVAEVIRRGAILGPEVSYVDRRRYLSGQATSESTSHPELSFTFE